MLQKIYPQNHTPCFLITRCSNINLSKLIFENKIIYKNNNTVSVVLCARFCFLKENGAQPALRVQKAMMGRDETQARGLWREKTCIKLSSQWFCDSHRPKLMVWIMTIRSSHDGTVFWLLWLLSSMALISTSFLRVAWCFKDTFYLSNLLLHLKMVTEVLGGGWLRHVLASYLRAFSLY